MTRDEKLLAKIKQLSTQYIRAENTKLKAKLARMEITKNNWKIMAERREAEIKELKEKMEWLEKNR